MKRLLLLAPLLLTGCEHWKHFSGTAGGAAQSSGVIRIGIDGQSEAQSPSDGQTRVYSTTGHVWVNDMYCEIPTGEPTCWGGMNMVQPTRKHSVRSSQTWIALADRLYAATGKDVYIYNSARGGRSTEQLLEPDTYNVFLNSLREHRDMDFVIFLQGQSEPVGITNETYRNMKKMIDDSRGIIPGLPWIVGLDSQAKEAQMKLAQDGLVIQGPDFDATKSIPGMSYEGGDELSYKGFYQNAQEYLDILMQYQPWNK